MNLKVGDKVIVRRNEAVISFYGEKVTLLPYSIEVRVAAVGDRLILEDDKCRLYDQHFYKDPESGVWRNPYGLYVVEKSPTVVKPKLGNVERPDIQVGDVVQVRRQGENVRIYGEEVEVPPCLIEATVSPRQRRQAELARGNEIVAGLADSIGIEASSIPDAARQLAKASEQLRIDQGLISSRSNPVAAALEELVPGIADLTGEARSQAEAQAARKFLQAGGNFDELAASIQPTPVAPGQRFQLQTIQPTILEQAFAPVQGTLGLAAEGIGKAAEGFNSLLGELRAIAAKPTYSVTVNANGQTVSATGTSANQQANLGRILEAAKRLAANGVY